MLGYNSLHSSSIRQTLNPDCSIPEGNEPLGMTRHSKILRKTTFLGKPKRVRGECILPVQS